MDGLFFQKFIPNVLHGAMTDTRFVTSILFVNRINKFVTSLNNLKMKISHDIRKLIVESYLHSHGNKQISSMFNVKYQTVCTIISVYKK